MATVQNFKDLKSNDDPVKEETDPTVRNILLIGASQNGKSALGNFLVTGKALDNSPVFGIGDGTMSCTTKLNAARAQWTYSYLPPEILKQHQIQDNEEEAKQHEKHKLCTFEIIDTPGTGDVNVNKEVENMELVYNRLKEMRDNQEELALALLVVKYPPFLSEELKANIIFYKKMLPEVMNLNVYLVITNVEDNEAWLKKQTKGGKKNPSTIIKEIQIEIQLWLEKNFEIPTVTIDSLFESDTPEEQNAVRVREILLATCVTSPGISLNGIRLPKTKRMLEEDKRNIEKLLGTKDGIHKGIALIEVSLSEVANKLADLSGKMEATASQLKQYEEEYADKNVDKLVVIHSEHITNGRRSHSTHEYQSFDVRTKFPIRNKIVARGIPKYTINEEKHVKGIIYASIWTNLNSTLTLSTYRREYYMERLTFLITSIATLKVKLDTVKREFYDITLDRENFKARLEAYRKQLVDIDKKLEEVKLEYIIL